jgi:hypothetical protein
VEKTIIAAWQQNGKHYMAYQNKVKSKTANVMMLPIPTNQTFKFHDTTPYKGFLSEIGKAVYADHMKGSRDLGAMPKGFERVGQYQFAQVQPEYVETTLNTLNQPIQTWLDRMLEAYNGWTWLFCIMDADTSMDSQPLLVEFDSIFPDKLYLPDAQNMVSFHLRLNFIVSMHVHHGEIQLVGENGIKFHQKWLTIH